MLRCAGSIVCGVLMIMFSWLAAGEAPAMDEPLFEIDRMVACEGISDREPVGAAATFPASTQKIYCFLEAGNVEQDTEVTFVWYHGKNETARVTLPLRAGPRWRTYSSKRLNGLKGEWLVDLVDDSGIVQNSISFTVE